MALPRWEPPGFRRAVPGAALSVNLVPEADVLELDRDAKIGTRRWRAAGKRRDTEREIVAGVRCPFKVDRLARAIRLASKVGRLVQAKVASDVRNVLAPAVYDASKRTAHATSSLTLTDAASVWRWLFSSSGGATRFTSTPKRQPPEPSAHVR
eukprot:6457603-Prymnesium_polylepis.2